MRNHLRLSSSEETEMSATILSAFYDIDMLYKVLCFVLTNNYLHLCLGVLRKSRSFTTSCMAETSTKIVLQLLCIDVNFVSPLCTPAGEEPQYERHSH